MLPPEVRCCFTLADCAFIIGSCCTSQGINVFTVGVHAHLAAKEVVVRHFRNGTELPNILSDLEYDFNFQVSCGRCALVNCLIWGLQDYARIKPIKILPGDELMTTCVYDTMDRKKPTPFGVSTHEEMCLAFMIYYPKVREHTRTYTQTHAHLHEHTTRTRRCLRPK